MTDPFPPNPPGTTGADVTHQAREKLKGLAIGYVVYGLLALPGLAIPAIVGAQKAAFEAMIQDAGGAESGLPELVELLEMFAQAAVVLVIVHLLVHCIAAWALLKRRFYWATFIAGILALPAIPFGSVLGIFTLIVLTADDVKAAYGKPPATPITTPASADPNTRRPATP